MARMYKVSADTSEKEKAVGGIMTFGQAGWLVLGFLIFAGLFLLLANIKVPVVLAVILSLPPGAVFIELDPLSHISALSAQFQAKV